MKTIKMRNSLFLIFLLLLSSESYAQKTPGLALTPPMGWNSWNKFGCRINEKIMKEMTDALVSSGMNKLGYEYVVLDDCWQSNKRNADGTIAADSIQFPSGIKNLSDYVHSKGLKFGIHTCGGTLSCNGRPGSHNYEKIDAETYAKWGVDYVKYDWCYSDGFDPVKSYTDMSTALAQSGRPIVFSMCEWGGSRPWVWAKNVGHLWRTTGDIQDCWDCKADFGGFGWTSILDMQVGLEKYAGPDHWNDPDGLEVGNGTMKSHEYAAHFSFWCLLAAPLMAGNDLRTMDDSTKIILTNRDAIKINQDKLGIQGKKIFDEGDFEIWSKKLSNNETAIIFFSRNWREKTFPIDWKELGIKHNRQVYDIWKHTVVGNTRNISKVTLPPRSVLFYKLQ